MQDIVKQPLGPQAIRKGTPPSREGGLGALITAVGSDLTQRWVPMQCVCVAAWLLEYTTAAAGIERTFWRFLVFNVLYTFGFVYWRERRVRSVVEAAYTCLGNCAMFGVMTALKALLASRWLVWLYVPLFCVVLVPLEYCHFRLFNDPRVSDERYVIRRSPRPTDNLLSLAVAVMFVIGAFNLDCSEGAYQHGHQLFVYFVFKNIITDVLFGVAHNLAHRVPWLWAKHKIHHEYRDNELNTFANFYSDFVDGLTMTYPLAISMFVDYYMGMPVWSAVDGTALSVFSHNKYSKLYIGQYMTYEIDIFFDVILGKKLADFHHSHHRDMRQHFSVFGVVSDRTVSALADLLCGSVKGKHDEPTSAVLDEGKNNLR